MSDLIERAYVGKCKHGISVAAICESAQQYLDGDKEVSQFIGEMVRDGLAVERVFVGEINVMLEGCADCKAERANAGAAK